MNKALKQFLIPKLSISPKAFLFTLYLTPKILTYCIPRKIIDNDFISYSCNLSLIYESILFLSY